MYLFCLSCDIVNQSAKKDIKKCRGQVQKMAEKERKMNLKEVLSKASANIVEDLSSYDELLDQQLAKLKENGVETTKDKLLLAVLKYVEDLEAMKRDEKKERISFAKIKDTKRFFINIGSIDGIDEKSLMQFLMDNVVGLTIENFADAFVRPAYSFFETNSELQTTILESVNNVKYKDREVHVELSEQKQKGQRDFKGGSRGGSRGGSSRGGFRSESRGGFHSESRGGFRGESRGGFHGESRGSSRGGSRESFGGRRESSRGDRDNRSRDNGEKPRYRYSDAERDSRKFFD